MLIPCSQEETTQVCSFFPHRLCSLNYSVVRLVSCRLFSVRPYLSWDTACKTGHNTQDESSKVVRITKELLHMSSILFCVCICPGWDSLPFSADLQSSAHFFSFKHTSDYAYMCFTYPIKQHPVYSGAFFFKFIKNIWSLETLLYELLMSPSKSLTKIFVN